MFDVAIDEITKEKMAAQPSREELDKLFPHSPRMKKRIMAISKKHENVKKRHRLLQHTYKVAAAVSLFIIFSSVIFFSVEASILALSKR